MSKYGLKELRPPVFPPQLEERKARGQWGGRP